MRLSVSLEMEGLFRFFGRRNRYAKLDANAYLLDMAHAEWSLCGELHGGIDVPPQQTAWQNARRLRECRSYRQVPDGLVVAIFPGSVLTCQFFVGFVGLCICLFPWKWNRLFVSSSCIRGSALSNELPTHICWTWPMQIDFYSASFMAI